MPTESRTVQEQPTAVLRAMLAPDEVSSWMLPAFDAVADYLRRHGIAPCGFAYARYHLQADGHFEVEAGFPVAVRIEGDNHVRPSSLPGGHVVVAWHIGPYEELGDAYRAVDDWLRIERGTRSGDAWEVYHDLPQHLKNMRIEVVQPFALKAVRNREVRVGRRG